jgi:hypothetical protein
MPRLRPRSDGQRSGARRGTRPHAAATWPAAAFVLFAALAIQLAVGTLGGAEGGLRLDRPYHQDYWYYAALARAVRTGFFPENPTFAGEPLTQHSLHLIPLGLLSLAMNPYLAMRVLNFLYCVLFLLLLRRYFPRRYGLVALCLLLCAPPHYTHNPVAVDLMTRGFQHFPFFFLLLPTLFEKRRRALRVAATALLPWAHGMMALAFGPAVLYVAWREDRRLLIAYGAGLASAAASVMIVSGGAGGANLLEHLRFEPRETLLHLVPLGVAFLWTQAPLPLIAAAGGVVLSSVIAWLRYYFLFPIDVGTALAAATAASGATAASAAAAVPGKPLLGPRVRRWVTASAILLAFAFFTRGMIHQFGPLRPFDRRPVASALAWIAHSTPPDAVFLVAPTPREFEADDSFYRTRGYGYWLAEIRDLYVGFFGWAEVVGLPGVDRSIRAHRFFSNEAPPPEEVDYVFFGPMEQGMYPQFSPEGLAIVYRDEHVAVLKVR